ncbi:Hint domain-containing protein [uncultured Tateyamaria sp.]|uniref:Hint domain-containing protein n=1 Tax=uncultured Tateyamaria sp. TaxID=455651 RepID=UPI00261DE3CA|nr:Hint domain-containing protein [uncultured Tateyamaria sp.]
MFGWTTKTATHRMPEMSGACDGGVMHTRGLLSGTRLATALGWRPVEALTAGDLVLTFDHGLQPLVEVRRDTFWVAEMMAPATFASIMVPAGALGNGQPLELLPDQGVLVETEAACDAHGDPFAVVPAAALVGFRGIERVAPRAQVEVITLVFADDQVAYAEGGGLVHCPRATMSLAQLGQTGNDYDVIPARDAAFLVACMAAEDRLTAAA